MELLGNGMCTYSVILHLMVSVILDTDNNDRLLRLLPRVTDLEITHWHRHNGSTTTTTA